MIIGTTTPTQRIINHTITTPTLFRISWNAALNSVVRITGVNEDLPSVGYRDILVLENKVFVITAVDSRGLQTLRTINIGYIPTAPTIPTTPIVPTVPTYSLTRSPNVVTEGSSVIFTMNTTNVVNGTSIPYVISGSGITSNDIGNVSLTGNFIIQDNTATVTLNITSDLIAEGSETLIMSAAGQTTSVTISDPTLIGPGALLQQDGLELNLENAGNISLQA